MIFKIILSNLVVFALFFTNSAVFSQDDNITAQEVIQNVQSKYKDITDATASFTQTIKFNKSKAQTSSGTLYIKKETKYRIETGTQTIVTDGGTSWVIHSGQETGGY
ncbi:MAG: outer membrane lipoprotein carrier protein LolA [Ignavibacteria bacterium]